MAPLFVPEPRQPRSPGPTFGRPGAVVVRGQVLAVVSFGGVRGLVVGVLKIRVASCGRPCAGLPLSLALRARSPGRAGGAVSAAAARARAARGPGVPSHLPSEDGDGAPRLPVWRTRSNQEKHILDLCVHRLASFISPSEIATLSHPGYPLPANR